MAKIKKKIKTIKIDADKCNGCRGCEIACSSFHATPKYSAVNPAKSRIQVISRRLDDIWLPVIAGEYTPAECMGRDVYLIDGKNTTNAAFVGPPALPGTCSKSPIRASPSSATCARVRTSQVCRVVPQRCPGLRGAGRGSRGRLRSGRDGGRGGIPDRQIRGADGNRCCRPNGKQKQGIDPTRRS